MDNIKYLLTFLFKFAIIFFVAALLWWAVKVFFPEASIRALLSSLQGTSVTQKSNGGWLPSPRSFKGLLGSPKVPTSGDNVYTPGPAFDGYKNAYNGNLGGAQVDFITYTSTGTQIIHGVGTPNVNQQPDVVVEPAQVSQTSTAYQDKNIFIRNLSIYKGGHVYTGLSFVGEARETMFKDGKFPIIMADQTGRVLSVSYGEATTNWAVPGWVRFQVKINGVFPSNVPCTMVFEQAMMQGSHITPTRVGVPVMCN
jgi:hypothetical protein